MTWEEWVAQALWVARAETWQQQEARRHARSRDLMRRRFCLLPSGTRLYL